MMIRNIVMSDTGGWLPQLLRTFDLLGIDAEAATIPEGMRVLHLGDILHKGPFSKELLQIISRLIVNNPGQWIQLMGNHEAQHIAGAPMFWPCDCTKREAYLLLDLLQQGLMTPTFAISDKHPFVAPDGINVQKDTTELLFAHGGLTAGFWEWKTEGVEDVLEVSKRLNELPIQEVTAPGLLLGESVRPRQVGPVWAIGNSEVFESWKENDEKPMPFGQVHGHTTSYSFDQKKWWPGLEQFQNFTVLLPEQRAVATELNNNLMLGVDPGFSEREPRIDYQTWFEFETLK